jgi:hypothetical protein
MTHERIPNVEGGEHGEDWLADAADVEPEPLEGVPVGDLPLVGAEGA